MIGICSVMNKDKLEEERSIAGERNVDPVSSYVEGERFVVGK